MTKMRQNNTKESKTFFMHFESQEFIPLNAVLHALGKR